MKAIRACHLIAFILTKANIKVNNKNRVKKQEAPSALQAKRCDYVSEVQANKVCAMKILYDNYIASKIFETKKQF